MLLLLLLINTHEAFLLPVGGLVMCLAVAETSPAEVESACNVSRQDVCCCLQACLSWVIRVAIGLSAG